MARGTPGRVADLEAEVARLNGELADARRAISDLETALPAPSLLDPGDYDVVVRDASERVTVRGRKILVLEFDVVGHARKRLWHNVVTLAGLTRVLEAAGGGAVRVDDEPLEAAKQFLPGKQLRAAVRRRPHWSTADKYRGVQVNEIVAFEVLGSRRPSGVVHRTTEGARPTRGTRENPLDWTRILNNAVGPPYPLYQADHVHVNGVCVKNRWDGRDHCLSKEFD